MNLRNSALTAALVLMLVGGAAAVPANADTAPSTLPAIQAAGAHATADRIAALNRSIPSITANACMADASRAQALGTLSAALDGMQELSGQIAAATDAVTAAGLYRSIFEHWRVYAVAIPQAHFAAAADCLQGRAIPALLSAQARLEAALAGVHADDVTPEIEADMQQLADQIVIAQDAAAGLADDALAVTPADYNADRAVLVPVKTALSTATSAARLAKAAAQSVVDALR